MGFQYFYLGLFFVSQFCNLDEQLLFQQKIQQNTFVLQGYPHGMYISK